MTIAAIHDPRQSHPGQRALRGDGEARASQSSRTRSRCTACASSDVASGRPMAEVLPELLRFIGSRPLVGYYLEFDVAMLNKHVRRLIGIELPNRRIEVSGSITSANMATRRPAHRSICASPRILDDLGLPMLDQHDAFVRRADDGDDVCHARRHEGPQHPHPAPARELLHQFRRRLNPRADRRRSTCGEGSIAIRGVRKFGGTTAYSMPERIIAAGRVKTQAIAMLRTVPHCMPEPLAAIVPADARRQDVSGRDRQAEAVRRADGRRRDQFRRRALAVGEMGLADLLADGDDDALPADHRAEAQGDRDADLDPDRDELGGAVELLLEGGDSVFSSRLSARIPCPCQHAERLGNQIHVVADVLHLGDRRLGHGAVVLDLLATSLVSTASAG